MRKLIILAIAVLLAVPCFAVDEEEEAKVVKEIPDLVQKIHDCKKTGCDLFTLAQLRIKLGRDVATAEDARNELEKTIKDARTQEEKDKVPDLKKRRDALVAAIETTAALEPDLKAISGDDLVIYVKTAEDLLSAAEKAKDEDKRIELRSQLAQLERQLRAQGLSDRARLKKIDETLKAGRLDLDYNKLVKERKQIAARLDEIDQLVTLPADGDPLYRAYDDDYEDWWIHTFYAGMEFDSVSTIFNKGFARIGYSNSLHFGGEGTPESHPRRGRANYGYFYEFNALLTSSAEQTFKKGFGEKPSDPCSPNFEGDDPCVRRALEAENKLFWPMYRTTRHNRLRHYYGPVVSVGARFIDPPKDGDGKDDSIHADYRYYVGMHLGFARDGYGEMLFGRTSGLSTRRIEVRGEVPVAHWGTDSRLLLGWSANFRAGHVRSNSDVNVTPERDSFRVWVTYNLDFLKLVGLKAPDKDK